MRLPPRTILCWDTPDTESPLFCLLPASPLQWCTSHSGCVDCPTEVVNLNHHHYSFAPIHNGFGLATLFATRNSQVHVQRTAHTFNGYELATQVRKGSVIAPKQGYFYLPPDFNGTLRSKSHCVAASGFLSPNFGAGLSRTSRTVTVRACSDDLTSPNERYQGSIILSPPPTSPSCLLPLPPSVVAAGGT